MTVKAFTLGYPPAYEKAVRIPGNAKAPGGYAFRTKADAEAYVAGHEDPSVRSYKPYAMLLPDTFEACTTRSFHKAAQARHGWHQSGPDAVDFMDACGICIPREIADLDCDLLLVSAPFVRPDG